jgi:hypothetical protein
MTMTKLFPLSDDQFEQLMNGLAKLVYSTGQMTSMGAETKFAVMCIVALMVMVLAYTFFVDRRS